MKDDIGTIKTTIHFTSFVLVFIIYLSLAKAFSLLKNHDDLPALACERPGG